MTSLSNDLKKVFVNMVRTSNFLTQNAKKDAILVAEHLKIIIGRPLTIADDFNVVYTNNDIWQNFNNYFKYRHKFMLSLINKYILNLPDINWNAYPFEFSGSQIFNLKMSYSQLTNTVYVPLACLQPPLLDLNGQSLEYNLGNIGFLLVSYMMRSVNLEGSTYDYNGIYRRLWSKTDYDKYAVYSDDLLRQYLKEYHKKQQLEYVLIKLKIKHLYTYIAYLLREKIWSYTHNDKLGGIPYMINELILNLMISRSNYFQGIYNIHKNDGMYYNNNKKTIEFL